MVCCFATLTEIDLVFIWRLPEYFSLPTNLKPFTPPIDNDFFQGEEKEKFITCTGGDSGDRLRYIQQQIREHFVPGGLLLRLWWCFGFFVPLLPFLILLRRIHNVSCVTHENTMKTLNRDTPFSVPPWPRT